MEIKKKKSPSRILLYSFLWAILVGTIILMLPISNTGKDKFNFFNALFTITSAVSVTGLSIVDISTHFTLFGQVIILIFIQLGGLGIMTFSSFIFILIGKKISYHERKILQEDLNTDSLGQILDYMKRLVRIVLLIEVLGAIFLTAGFSATLPFSQAIYYGIFHSISAFCNAGFTLFSNNLESFTGNELINITISILIVIGGIGFAVINSTIIYFKTRHKQFNITSKLVIKITLFLILLGSILFLFLEYNNSSTIGNLKFSEKVLASIFQSITTRTAGFNTISMNSLEDGTIFMFYLLMAIGASPGSTGGGIKTTTIGILAIYVFGIINGKVEIEIGNRSISWEILNRALAVLVISILYITVVSFLIFTFDSLGFKETLFEVISAFSTVGLSISNTTMKLNIFSKILIIITMLVGRLGPLTFALALGQQKTKKLLKYPKENILIG